MLFAGVWAILVVPILFAWQARRARNLVPGSSDTDPYVFDEAATSVVTGARVGNVSASWPLARVTFDHNHLRLQCRGLHVFPTVAVPRTEVTGVRRTTRLWDTKIYFETRDGWLDRVAIFPLSADRFSAELARRGWPITRD